MKTKLEQILAVILKDTASIVPIIIHDPVLQTISAIVLADASAALAIFSKPGMPAPETNSAPAN